MSHRQSIVERARRETAELNEEIDAAVIEEPVDNPPDDSNDIAILDDETREKVVNAKLAERASRRSQSERGPSSRPTRRRTTAEPSGRGEDGFPWTFQLDDEDEPEELQASTPLLSRAFRATTG